MILLHVCSSVYVLKSVSVHRCSFTSMYMCVWVCTCMTVLHYTCTCVSVHACVAASPGHTHVVPSQATVEEWMPEPGQFIRLKSLQRHLQGPLKSLVPSACAEVILLLVALRKFTGQLSCSLLLPRCLCVPNNCF